VSLIANVDVQGVRNFRAAAETFPLLKEKMVTIFVAPDSLDVLRERLQGRGPVSEDELARRLQSAEFELAERNSYDYVIHSASKEQDFRSLLAYWEQARLKLA
jgi:guanylate kinase